MSLDASFVERFVGQQVKDPFGRILGTVVSMYSNVDGVVEGIELAKGNNVFEFIPADRLMRKNDELVIMPVWMAEARRVYKQLDTAIRRVKALNQMLANGDVSKQIVNEMKKKMEAEVNKLKGKVEDVKKKLRERLGELEDQILEMDKTIVNLQMTYMSGEISERNYKGAIEIIRHQKEIAFEEKKAIKEWQEKLEKLEREHIEEKYEETTALEEQGPIMLSLTE